MSSPELQFLRSLEDWVVAEPRMPLSIPYQPAHEEAELNCQDPSFSAALSGISAEAPTLLIDFIPFGYDVDKLEFRLLETYAHLDFIVLFESHLTQVGTPKPFIWPRLRNTPRFKRFTKKLVYFTPTADELAHFIPAVKVRSCLFLVHNHGFISSSLLFPQITYRKEASSGNWRRQCAGFQWQS